MKKRMTAILMAAAMCLSLLPASAFAAGEQNVTVTEETTTEPPALEETTAEETTTETAATLAETTGAVVYVSSTGSDSGSGTETSPYATLQKAYSKIASTGGTIYVSGTVTDGPSSDPRVMLGSRSTTVVIEGITNDAVIQKTTCSRSDYDDGMILLYHASGGTFSGSLTIKNLTLDGTGNTRTSVVIANYDYGSSSADVTLEDVTLKGIEGSSVMTCGKGTLTMNNVTFENGVVNLGTTQTITATGPITATGTVTITNGGTSGGGIIVRSSSFTDGAMFQVGESGTAGALTLSGVTLQGDGTTASGKIIEVVNGSVTMTGATVQNFVGSAGTNYMISVDKQNTNSSLTMDSSSKLTGNTVNGTALLGVGYGNTAALTGTSVTGNIVNSGYLLLAGTVNNSRLTLDGVTITGNTMSDSGYALRAGVANGAANVLVKGATKITDNTTAGGAQHNVYLLENGKLALDSALDTGASIGVTTADTPSESSPVTVAEGEGGYTATSADALRFTADNAAYLVVYKDSAVKLSIGDDYYVSAPDATPAGSDTDGDGSRTKPFATIQKAYDEITTAGTIHVMSDLDLSSQITFDGSKTVTIVSDSNGDLTDNETYTITRGTDLTKVTMLTVTGENTDVTLKNIIFDGNKDNVIKSINALRVEAGATLTLDAGAVVQNNRTGNGSGETNDGAGVVVNAATLNILDGAVIQGNETYGRGGGVSTRTEDAVVNMTGGTITGNSRTQAGYPQGGGVYLEKGTFNMSGGSITGNSTTYNGSGGGVYLGTGGALNVSGTAVISDNTSGAEGSVKTDNIYLQSDQTIGVSGTLSDGAKIGVTTATTPAAGSDVTVATGASAGDAARFFSDNAAYSVVFDSDAVKLSIGNNVYVSGGGSDTDGDGTPTNPYATIGKALEAAGDGATIHVMTDLTLSATVTISKSVTIVSDSDGDLTDNEAYTITRNFTNNYDNDNSLFYVSSGYTMTLRGLTLDGQNMSIAERGPGVFVASGGTLTAENCVFLNHNATSSRNGSAVYSAGSVTLTNCEFKDNTDANGAIYLSAGTLTLSDSSITGSTSYGVYAAGGTLNLSGSVQITGNESGNLYLPGGVTAKLTAALGESASIGVTTATAPTAGSDVTVATGSSYTVTVDDAARFFSDNAAYSVVYNDDGTVALSIGNNLYVSNSGSDDTGDGTPDKPYATIGKALENAADGAVIHVMSNLTLSTTVAISQNVTIVSDSDGDLTNEEQFTLTRDSTFTGINSNTTLFKVTGGTAEFQNLTIDGNEAVTTASYPAISVTNGATATLSGATKLTNHTIGGDNGTMDDKGVIYLYNGTLNIKDEVSITGNNNIKTNTTNLVIQGYVPENDTTTVNTVNMTGGSITGNQMKSAVMNVGSSLTLNVSGNAVISGNTDMDGNAANVSLGADSTVTVTGELTGGAKIGVTTATAPTTDSDVTVAVSGGAYAVTESDAAAFFSDNAAYSTKYDSDNNAVVLSIPYNPLADGTYEVTGAKDSESIIDGVTYRENLTDGAFSSNSNWKLVNAADTLFSTVEVKGVSTYLKSNGGGKLPDNTSGNVLELNGTSQAFPETIYQEVNVLPGSTVYISFWYIKRDENVTWPDDDDTQQMMLSVLPHSSTGSTKTYTIPSSGTYDRTTFVEGAITGDHIQLYQYSGNTDGSDFAHMESAAVTVNADSADTATSNTYPANTVISAGTEWTKVVATYTVPDDVYSVYVAFHSVTPVGNGAGNILAMASVKTAQLEDAYVSRSGSDTTGGGTITAPFATLDKALEWVKAGGTIHVMDDLTLTSGLTIGKNVTIVADSDGDLEDDDTAKITRDSGFTSGSMITVNADYALTLKGLTLDGGSAQISAVAGGGVYVNDGAALTAENCTFQNHKMGTSDKGEYGAAVANSGTTTLTSCVFQNNWVASSGSAVYNIGGEMTITGSTFTNNTCNASQGTLFVHGGTVTVTGTSFTGNTAAYGGAAVFQSGGALTLGKGVTISGNTVSGGIDRGAVWVNDANAALTVLDGVTIQNNTGCSGVYLEAGTLNLNGGSITGNACYGVNVYSNAPTLNLSGNVQITDNTSGNLYLSSGVTAKLTAALGDGANIGVTTATNPSTSANIDVAVSDGNYTVTESDAARFFSDKDVYQTFYNTTTTGSEKVVLGIRQDYYVSASGNDTNGTGTRDNPYATLVTALGVVPDGGTIYVMNDITFTDSISTGNSKSVTIATDPEVLTTNEDGTVSGVAVVTMNLTASTILQTGGATLTLKDIVFNGSQSGSYAPFILGTVNGTDYGKLVLESGAVIRNYSTNFGAVWTNTSGSNAITIKAGASITGNTNTLSGNKNDSGYGGAITLRGGTLTIEGGEITGNTATYGGGVYAAGGTTVNISGDVQITGNTATTGGGVYVVSGGTLNLSGDVTITGNTSGNLYLPSGVTAKLTAALGDGASIGVTTATAPTVNSNVNVATGSSYTVTESDAAKFTSDNTDYEAALSGSYVVLTTGNKLYVSSSGNNSNAGTRSSPLLSIYGAITKCTTSGSSYEIILLSDVNLASGYSSGSTNCKSPGAGTTVTIRSDDTEGKTYSILWDQQSILYVSTANTTLTLKNVTYKPGTYGTSSNKGEVTPMGVNANNSSIILDEGATLDGLYSIYAAAYLYTGHTGSQIIMKPGSKIVNCTNTSTSATSSSVSTCGSAVYVGSGTFVMEGGEISGNTATGNSGISGGVYVGASGAMTVSGAPVVTGNKCVNSTSNVYLVSGKTITVAGALTGDAKIGVTQSGAAKNVAFATSGSGYTVTASDAAAFFHDAGTLDVAVSGSSLVWASAGGTATVTELYSYAEGTGVTAAFQVTYTGTPTASYTVAVTGGSGSVTAATQGGFHGSNYVVKVTGLTAGQTYTVSAVVDGTVCPGGLSWTAPAATYSSHGDSANTNGYWSTNNVAYRTDNGTVTDEVASGIAYRVIDDRKIDIQGYSQTRTTYANAGWTVLTSGGSDLQVWAFPTIVSGDSGADYVVLTYYVRNNSETAQSDVWLGANADIMIGVNDKAPVYKESYGLRTAVSTDADALSFAIITQHSDTGVAANADTVSTLWFGYWKDRTANTFKNATATKLTGTDSGAAFSWKITSLAAGEVASKSVVIGVAGKDDQTKDITGSFADFIADETGSEPSVTITEQQLSVEVEAVTEGIQVTVAAGQTYVLTNASGEIVDTYEATADGTYTFSGLLSSVTYTVTTRRADVETTDENGNVTAITQYTEGTAEATPLARTQTYTGVIVLNDADKNVNDLTYTFPIATAQIKDSDGNVNENGKFYNVSVMVDSGSFTLTSDALAALSSYTAVSGLDASGNYITSVTGENTYTYLIFSFTDGVLASSVQSFLQALTFTVAGYGVSQRVDVDADVIELPSGVVRLGSSYYRYVAYKAITWSNAYKAAKNSAFNGLTGYLMTVDSALEHNFVYQAFGSVNGWMGGLRTTATSGFDTATYATSNPNKSGTWKWVCGPNAGTEFWKGYSSSTSNAVTGVYANWKSGEPNNSTYEYAAQYGYGTGGKWNDYKPTNSSIGGYFIEYTAYGGTEATSPMAHYDKTTEFGSGVIVSTNGVNGTTDYESVAAALTDLNAGNGHYDSETQVLRLTADFTEQKEETITVNENIYLDLNGHSDTTGTLVLGDNVTLYGMDSATDGYNDAKAGTLIIQGDARNQVATITTTTADQTSTAKRYVAVTSYDETEDTTTVEFHRFNVWVMKVSGTYWYDTSTNQVSASLTYTMGVRGDAAAMKAITGLGTNIKTSDNSDGVVATGTLDSYDIASDKPSNYSTYTVKLISSDNKAEDYSTEFSVSAAVSFDDDANVLYTSTAQTRSLLDVLKSYYNKTATAAEKEQIEKFITQAGLADDWNPSTES